MKYPVKYVIEIASEEEQKILETVLSGHPIDPLQVSTWEKIQENSHWRLIDPTKEARVRIGAQQIAVGTEEEMATRYANEIGMHYSNVVMDVWCDGDYKIAKQRKLQRI